MHSFAGTIGLYSLSHFAVDFTCAFYIFSNVPKNGQWLLCLLIYNFFAFALQMPLGVLADRLEKNRSFALGGTLIVACSVVLDGAPLFLCAAAGIGNALFHIGAGRDVLCGSGGKFAPLGVFVSPGAIGLFFGISCAKNAVLPYFLPAAVLILLSWAILALAPKSTSVKKTSVKIQALRRPLIVFAVCCLFLVVCIRSFVGMTLSFPWKPEPYMALLLTAALALGKAAGGFLADRFGAKPTAVVTLLLSAVLFVFFRNPVGGIFAVFFFNMTMPITLCAVTRLMPHSYGLGFGLLTFGLFLGAMPILLGPGITLPMPVGAVFACAVSALLLLGGVKGVDNG